MSELRTQIRVVVTEDDDPRDECFVIELNGAETPIHAVELMELHRQIGEALLQWVANAAVFTADVAAQFAMLEQRGLIGPTSRAS